MASLEPWFLDLLACPRCHGKVSLAEHTDGLVCSPCALIYPIEEEIPQLLPDAGRLRPDAGEKASST